MKIFRGQSINRNDIRAIDEIDASPIMMKFNYRIIKRTIDLLASSIGLLVLSPIFLVLGILIRLMSEGPAIYAYDEIGRKGKKFKCFKFRTMVVKADQMVDMLMDKNEMDGPVFKIKEDPRITKLGRFLRKYSIDELPQLFCVLKGEMSLVGPRPALPREWQEYQPWQKRRLSVTPGITGMWQVYGRNKVNDFNKWVSLDLEYIDEWSIWLDFKILAKTVEVVLRGTGM